MKKMRLLALVLALFLAIIATTSYAASATNQPSGGSHFVRVPATAQTELARLPLTPAISLDYGSFLWLELNDADMAALAASGISYIAEPDAGQVQVVAHRFDPLADGEPAVAPAMKADASQPGFHLVQFNGPVRSEWLRTLEANGLPMLQYYPHNAYLTWGSAAAVESVTNFSFVRWQGAIHPAYKVDPNLRGYTGLIQNVDIMFYNDGNIDATLAALRGLGANVLQHYPAQPDRAFYDAVVEIDANALADVANLNTVLWLGFLGPAPILDDEMSSQIVAGNHPGGVPVTGYSAHLAALGVDGSGVTWAVIDTGVDYDHPDLGPNIVGGYSFPGACNPPGQPGSDCSNGGHGTHVAGIVGGTGVGGFTDPNGFLYGLGVAPGYSIFAMNSLSAAAWPPAGGWQEHSKQAVLGGAIGGNNSWTTGEGANHGYQASERTHDIMVRDGNFDTASVAEPFIEVFSAGNSGPSPNTLTAPKEGKNLIIVASSLNFRVGNINTISSFSSRGPAVDGRWVPTITTPGEQIASARNDIGGVCATPIPGTNNLYAYCSGTSMAAPHASGAVVLFTEWWRGFNSGDDPSPAMAKALLVNGAVDMGTADIPNIHEGWGRVNITNIISPSVLFEFWDQTHLFTDTGQQLVLTMGVPDPTKPVKITLTWSDAPGAVGANPALVNNLNLTVVNNSNTYLGNVFSGGWSVTGGSADNINNLENVYIQNPGGDLTIIIDAANIAGDGVPYNGDITDQDFALVCQNCALNNDFTLSATPPNQSICTPADAVYTVNVGSILGYDDPVTLSATGHPAGTTTDFSVNPVTPPGSSSLTIGNTGAAAAGSYNINVVGVAPTSTHTTTVGLTVFTAVPGAPTLLSPTNGAMNVSATPTFTWSDAGSSSYLLEVATDIGFSNIVYSANVSGTSHTAGAALNTSTTYFWRVRGSNTCGDGSYSAVFIFTTEAAPGDCGPGTAPNVIYEYGFESGDGGWTTSGTGNTWALSTANPHSGQSHFHGNGVATISDQRLASPAVVLPTGQNPVTLEFWHAPYLEVNPPGCYDGGILEISNNGGSTWTQVPNANLLVGPYTGVVSSGFSNPLAGLQAWCGTNATYFNTIADVSAYAGQTVQFRMRLGTDSSVSRPGWDVDDVTVQSCMPSATPAIVLTKTVGVEPTVYPTTDVITVTSGTEVTYFYVVENTGDVTLSLHTLQDDQLGIVIGPDYPYSLAPGETVMITSSVTVTDTVTNVANWVATDGGANTAVAGDSATVHVVNPAVSLSKTVGTEPGVCATTDTITVESGTEVYYCYTVTNEGDVTLSLHDLADDQLGAILTGFAYDLAPGASVDTVAAGLTLTATIMTTTTNTAVWTAYNDAAITASATASATVNVTISEIWYWIYLPAILKP